MAIDRLSIFNEMASRVTSLEARFDHHDELLKDLKVEAKDMVKAINQIKYVLIVLAIAVLLNAGPFQQVFLKLLKF